MFFLLLCASALGWIYLVVLHGGFWRCDHRLDALSEPGVPDPENWPSVTVLVPARNEADVIEKATSSLLSQDYKGVLRICIINDNSEDATAGIIEGLIAADDRLALINADPLEAGWAGKMWALNQGWQAELAADQPADLILLTDADILHDPGSLTRLVKQMKLKKADLVSVMAFLEMKDAWARLLIPAFIFFFQMLYPFGWVNRPDRKTAAAAGGCILIQAKALKRIGGFEALKGALIDDCALAAKVKETGGRLWLGLSRSVTSIRAYEGLDGIWRMVSRSAYTQLGHSPWLLAGCLFGMTVLFVMPAFFLFFLLLIVVLSLSLNPLHNPITWLHLAPTGLAWFLMVLAFMPMLAWMGLSKKRAPWLPFAAVLYVAMTVDSARKYHSGAGGQWKGRVQVPLNTTR